MPIRRLNSQDPSLEPQRDKERMRIRRFSQSWMENRPFSRVEQIPDHKAGIEMRQIKYLNNIVEQDHRAIKRQIQPMLGFKSFWSAAVTLAGVELMHMIRKGQLLLRGELCSAQQFYSLAE
jgi:transposase-like protein